MTSGGRVLRYAVVMAVGLWLAPAAVSAAPADTVSAAPAPLPEGCSIIDGVEVCLGAPPVPETPMPEVVATPTRAAATPVVPVAQPVVVDAPAVAPQVASEAPVPVAAPAGQSDAVTFGQVASPAVASPAVASPVVVPSAGPADPASSAPVWALGLLVGCAVAMLGVVGFRRARVRS